MHLQISAFKICGQKVLSLKIKCLGLLTGSVAKELRTEINNCLDSDAENIYVDTEEVTEVDLSGINEIIHANTALEMNSKKLVLLFQQNSPVEKWVSTTQLDKFITTAIIPN